MFFVTKWQFRQSSQSDFHMFAQHPISEWSFCHCKVRHFLAENPSIQCIFLTIKQKPLFWCIRNIFSSTTNYAPKIVSVAGDSHRIPRDLLNSSRTSSGVIPKASEPPFPPVTCVLHITSSSFLVTSLSAVWGYFKCSPKSNIWLSITILFTLNSVSKCYISVLHFYFNNFLNCTLHRKHKWWLIVTFKRIT